MEYIQVPLDIENPLKNALEKLTEFDADKYELSAKLFRHYLGGTGDHLELKTDELEDIGIVSSAISKNQERFKNSFIGKKAHMGNSKPHSFYEALINLPDNGQITLSDYWDVDFQKSNLRNLLSPDFVRAIGSGKIRSKGNFQISKKGDTIQISGRVSNQINDLYDFNTDTLFDREFFYDYKLLADKDYAKPFTISWKKEIPFSGTITLQTKTFMIFYYLPLQIISG